jgi:DNA-binding protein Fis
MHDLVLEAIADGQTEAGVARMLGVDRMTIRKWLGKR